MSQLVAQKLILHFAGPGEHSVSGGGSNDKWEERSKTGSPGPGAPNQICHCSQWPIKIMDDARARQMEIMDIIFSKTITWWFTFLSNPEFYLKHPHLSVSSRLFWFVVIFLWWLIRPVPPSLHTSLFALVNAGPRFPPCLGSPNLQNVSQYQLPPVVTVKSPCASLTIIVAGSLHYYPTPVPTIMAAVKIAMFVLVLELSLAVWPITHICTCLQTTLF